MPRSRASTARLATAALTTKGSRRHLGADRWYYRAISTVFATTLLLTAMRPREDYHLTVMGLVAFTAATIGYLHRRRHRPGDAPHIIGMGASYIAMLTAFYVDNGPHLPLWDRLPSLSFWFLPGVIGLPIVVRALGRRAPPRGYTRRRGG